MGRWPEHLLAWGEFCLIARVEGCGLVESVNRLPACFLRFASGKAPAASYTCDISCLSQAIFIVNHHKGSGG
ncbi:hypothetical protein BK634_27830 [Pseudomonas chlororaphis]|jgi:hypothetical protein|nr:hypothetical protein BK634_27830 [Pseudomonas chlororaphis]